MVDNITLALMSLNYDLQSFLDANGWKNKYNMFLESSKEANNKVFVANVTDSRKEIGLPIVLIGTGIIFDRAIELGNNNGKDQIQLTLVVYAIDQIQVTTLANLIRRHLAENGFFSVFNFSSGVAKPTTAVDIATLENIVLNDYSDRGSPNVAERFVNVINAIMEINSNSYS